MTRSRNARHRDVETNGEMTDETRQQLDGLPPSAKLVFKVLEYNDELTQKQICTHSRLPSRTVRYALNQLQEIGLLEEDVHFPDARQSMYTLSMDQLSIDQSDSKHD